MSSPVIRRHTYAKPSTSAPPFIGIATSRPIPTEGRGNYVCIVSKKQSSNDDYDGYGAILTSLSETDLGSVMTRQTPVVSEADHVEHITDGDVLRIDFRHGLVRTLYRVNSRNNIIFATDRCNSNCLMCSQPPKDIDDGYLVDENLRLIDLVPPTTRDLTVTGGEPTLLGDGFFRIVEACRAKLPVTRLQV